MDKYQFLDYIHGLSLSINIEGPIGVKEIPNPSNYEEKQFLGSLNYYDNMDLSKLISYVEKEYEYELLDINLNSLSRNNREISFVKARNNLDDTLPKEITLLPRGFSVYALN